MKTENGHIHQCFWVIWCWIGATKVILNACFEIRLIHYRYMYLKKAWHLISVHSCSFVFTRVHSCSTHVHLCSTRVPLMFTRVPLVFTGVHSCSTSVHSCSLMFHSCSLVFIRVPLVFTRVHSCSFVFTRVHSCSDLCGVLDMIFQDANFVSSTHVACGHKWRIIWERPKKHWLWMFSETLTLNVFRLFSRSLTQATHFEDAEFAPKFCFLPVCSPM